MNFRNNKKRIAQLDDEIQLFMYKIYGITYDEACIIEGNTEWMSKKLYEQFQIENAAVLS